MVDTSGVGAARRHAATLAKAAGLNEVAAGRLALVVTELGSNLIKHAQHGRLLITLRNPQDDPDVEVLALDQGPGISNIARCLADGFSTVGTSGTGLGAVKRLADDFDMVSAVPGGTITLARVRAQGRNHPRVGQASAFQVGSVAIAAPGETVSGDGWVVALSGHEASVMVADGLGHGPQAQAAAEVAITAFGRSPFDDLCHALEGLHTALRSTRGAAVLAARLDLAKCECRYVGAGNVTARVVSGVSDRTLMTQNGTVGLQVRRAEEMRAEWPAHASVVLHSDGILTRWKPQVLVPLLKHDPTLSAAVLVRDYCRGRDDATVVVLRRKD